MLLKGVAPSGGRVPASLSKMDKFLNINIKISETVLVSYSTTELVMINAVSYTNLILNLLNVGNPDKMQNGIFEMLN